jgi:hypothetical protein
MVFAIKQIADRVILRLLGIVQADSGVLWRYLRRQREEQQETW